MECRLRQRISKTLIEGRLSRSSPSAAPPGGFPEDFSELICDGLAKPGDILVTKRQWGAFHGTELDLQLRRRGIQTTIVLGGVANRTWASSRRHDRHGNTAMPSFVLAEDATSGLFRQSPKCTISLLSATPFQGSAGSSKVLISRFLKPDSVAVYVFIHAASRRSLGSSGSLFRFCLPALLTWARLPAALLLGAMLAGILVENGGAGILVPQLPFGFAQASRRLHDKLAFLPPPILHSFLHQWPLFLGISLLVIVASCVLGWIISKLRILPETTGHLGIIGSWCGVRHDGDGRCLRRRCSAGCLHALICGCVVAWSLSSLPSLPACGFTHRRSRPQHLKVWFAPIHALPLIETLVLVVAAVVLGPVLHSGRNVPGTDVGRCRSPNQRSRRNRITKLAAGGQLSATVVDDRIAVHPGNSAVCHSSFTENDGIADAGRFILWRRLGAGYLSKFSISIL